MPAMKKLLRHKGIWILAAALSLCLIATALLLLRGGRAGLLSSVATAISRPFQQAAEAVEQNVSHLYGQAARYERLRLENEALARQVATLEDSAREALLAHEENERLRALLDVKAERRELHFEPARVQSESTTNWARGLTLSRGSAADITPRDCVVDENGRLIGVVTEVGENFSNVTLLCDAGFELPGESAQSGARGVLRGDFSLMSEGNLRLSYLPLDCALAPGDEILSASPEGLYPSGLLVGRVLRVERDPSGLYAEAILSPAAKLSALRQVFVITDFAIEDS